MAQVTLQNNAGLYHSEQPDGSWETRDTDGPWERFTLLSWSPVVGRSHHGRLHEIPVDAVPVEGARVNPTTP